MKKAPLPHQTKTTGQKKRVFSYPIMLFGVFCFLCLLVWSRFGGEKWCCFGELEEVLANVEGICLSLGCSFTFGVLEVQQR